jgi:hypothetical protein
VDGNDILNGIAGEAIPIGARFFRRRLLRRRHVGATVSPALSREGAVTCCSTGRTRPDPTPVEVFVKKARTRRRP